MGHNRKLVLSGVSLTKARSNKHDIDVAEEVMNEIEKMMLSSGYLKKAPFRWIGLTLRYGLKHETTPHYQRIDDNDGELPLAIELDTHDLVDASRDELKRLFTIATLKALIDAGKKYNLPVATLEDQLVTLSQQIPRVPAGRS